MSLITGLLYAALAAYLGGWYLGHWHGNFSLLLFILTVVTLAYWLAEKFKFARHGQSGAELSELLPHLAGVADDIAVVKSIHSDAFNHAPAQIFMNTGSVQFGRPSFGAWTTYGLGSVSSDLPAYVVFSTGSNISTPMALTVRSPPTWLGERPADGMASTTSSFVSLR